jgi:hypothetical protein
MFYKYSNVKGEAEKAENAALAALTVENVFWKVEAFLWRCHTKRLKFGFCH